MKLTDLDANEYVSSMALTEEPEKVYSLDGSHLVRIADDHYLVIVCTEHTDHRGHDLLVRVLPRDWSEFHAAANPAEGFEVHHYGPED